MTGQARSVPELLEKLQKFRSEEGVAYANAFAPRPSDVLIATFAKAGTTWMQQIVHGLRTGGDMDFSEITEAVPWIELAHDMGIDLDAEQKGAVRAFKTHWSAREVPAGCRYISVIRDPLDSAVSFYRFMDGWFIASGSIAIDDYVCEFFAEPYFEGGYWSHLMSWWHRRNDPDVLLLAFEDIKTDHAGAVRKVAEFLDIGLSDDDIEIATRQSTFDFMKRYERHFDDHLVVQARNAAVGLPPDASSTKVRSGTIGDHNGSLSQASVALLDQRWTETVGRELGFASYADLRAAL